MSTDDRHAENVGESPRDHSCSQYTAAIIGSEHNTSAHRKSTELTEGWDQLVMYADEAKKGCT